MADATESIINSVVLRCVGHFGTVQLTVAFLVEVITLDIMGIAGEFEPMSLKIYLSEVESQLHYLTLTYHVHNSSIHSTVDHRVIYKQRYSAAVIELS